MSGGPPDATSAHIKKHLSANWLTIVLTVVSIIQGLALNELATKIPNVIASSSAERWMAFAFCFAIVIRVFATYVVAAVHYKRWMPSPQDLYVVFALGLLEYYLFEPLGGPPCTVPPANAEFDFKSFYLRAYPICTLAVMGYVYALQRLRKPGYESTAEENLQWTNIWGSLIVFGFVIVLTQLTVPKMARLGIAAGITTLIVLNTVYSMKRTLQGLDTGV